MNVFIVSPGRTATTTFAHAFELVDGYTSAHESRCQYLGSERVNYPQNHVECDNRLTWFMARLTNKYADNSVLVIVHRDKSEVAKSYNQRWYKINIMKAYAQGILLRPLEGNDISVCRDYVDYVYEQMDFFSPMWRNVVHVDMRDLTPGITEVLELIGKPEAAGEVLNYMKSNRANLNSDGIKHRLSVLKFNFKCMVRDLFL